MRPTFVLLFLVAFSANADDDRISVLKQSVADQIHLNQFKNPLVSSGLAETDAEETAKSVALGVAACFVNAMLEGAKELGVSSKDFLDEVEPIVANDVGRKFDNVLFKYSTKERVLACIYEVETEAGIVRK